MVKDFYDQERLLKLFTGLDGLDLPLITKLDGLDLYRARWITKISNQKQI